jgi:hypothetical protein
MAHWLKVVVLLGLATMFFAPCDPACECTIGPDLAIVLELETGSSPPIRTAQTITHQPRRHSFCAKPVFQRHCKEVFSIIDLTCARLC